MNREEQIANAEKATVDSIREQRFAKTAELVIWSQERLKVLKCSVALGILTLELNVAIVIIYLRFNNIVFCKNIYSFCNVIYLVMCLQESV